MSQKIQVRRGVKSKLPTLDTGEIGLTTDTKELFIGAGGNVKLARHDHVFGTSSANSLTIDSQSGPYGVSVSSAGDFKAGDKVIIEGGGVGGTDLVTTVNEIKSLFVVYTIYVADEIKANPAGKKIKHAPTIDEKLGSLSETVEGHTLQLVDKADKTEINSLATNKADKTEVNSLATGKADITYVDTKVASVASGSPKGTYATVTDLTNAFPTGNTNIYLVTADGNWYWWNGSAWTAGGLYQNNDSVSVLTARTDGIIENSVPNGDFSNGTTGWGTINATISVSNNTLTVLGNGAGAYMYAQESTSLPLLSGHKYYSRAKVKFNEATTAQAIHLIPLTSGSPIVNSISQAVGTEAFVSFINEATTQTGNIVFRVRADYADATTQNGKSFTVKYATLIDLTNVFGVGNEPTKEEMDEIMSYYPNGWFEGKAKLNDTQKAILQYQLKHIRSLTVTQEKKRLIIPSMNGYVNTSGSITYSVNWETTPIVLKKGEKIEFTVWQCAGPVILSKWSNNAEWTYVSSIYAGSGADYSQKTFEYTATASIEWLRISHASLYGPLILYKYVNYNDDRDKNLYGKIMTITGDSYVANSNETADKAWHYKLASKYAMKYVPYGINGGGLVAPRPGITPVVDRYTEMPDNADYVVVIGGENDYNAGIDLASFKNGLNTLIEGLLNKYMGRTTKICFFTPWNYNGTGKVNGLGLSVNDYTLAIIERCNHYGIPVFNSMKDAGFYSALGTTYRERFFQSSTDYSHLNEVGHNNFYPKAEAFMLRM